MAVLCVGQESVLDINCSLTPKSLEIDHPVTWQPDLWRDLNYCSLSVDYMPVCGPRRFRVADVHDRSLSRENEVLPTRATEEPRKYGSGANARVADDDEEMQRFVPIEDLFKGRRFDRQIIVLGRGCGNHGSIRRSFCDPQHTL